MRRQEKLTRAESFFPRGSVRLWVIPLAFEETVSIRLAGFPGQPDEAHDPLGRNNPAPIMTRFAVSAIVRWDSAEEWGELSTSTGVGKFGRGLQLRQAPG